jgi:hypothetical protein
MRAVPPYVHAGQRQGSRLPAPPPPLQGSGSALRTEQTQALTALGVASRICWASKVAGGKHVGTHSKRRTALSHSADCPRTAIDLGEGEARKFPRKIIHGAPQA